MQPIEKVLTALHAQRKLYTETKPNEEMELDQSYIDGQIDAIDAAIRTVVRIMSMEQNND